MNQSTCLPMPSRFWSRVEKGPSCWNWTGGLCSAGYGSISIGGKSRLAHRIAWELERGPIPDGLEIDHLCRNRRCVLVEHMELVTRRVNQIRGMGVSGIAARKTACVHGHAFTAENTRITPDGRRSCRTCGRLRYHASRAAVLRGRRK